MSGLIAIWVYGALCVLVGAWLGWLRGKVSGELAEARAWGLLFEARRRQKHAWRMLLQAKILMGAPMAPKQDREPVDPADWWKRN